MARNWKLLVKPQRGNEAVDRLNDEDLRRCRVCSTGQIRKAFGVCRECFVEIVSARIRVRTRASACR